VTVADDDPDKLAAELLAGELPPTEAETLRRRIDADPAARDALARMEAAVEALHSWRATFDHLPPPPIPRPRRRSLFRFWPAAAAAVLAVGLLVLWLVPRQKEPPADDWARAEFAGLVGDEPEPGRVHELPMPAVPRPERRMGGPGGPDGGAAEEAKDVLRRFAAQFDFAFRVPAGLPDGYVLQRGQPLSEKAVRLTYEGDGKRRHVYVKASPGPDEAPRRSELPGAPVRTLWTTRRAGLAVAADGPGIDQETLARIADLVVPD
jgi:hypothetical protein